MNPDDWTKHDHVLIGLVTQYQTLAMVHLGKLQNPVTGELERDLEHARAMIDVLQMLKVKCRTDTPQEIVRLMDQAVMDLQLNYMDEVKKDKAEPPAEPPAEDAAAKDDA